METLRTAFEKACALDVQIRATARKLSKTVLYGKALQNIPVVGAIGGAGDAACLSRSRGTPPSNTESNFCSAVV